MRGRLVRGRALFEVPKDLTYFVHGDDRLRAHRSARPIRTTAELSDRVVDLVRRLSDRAHALSPDDLIVMAELRRVFDPRERSNPNKVIPTPGACVEVTAPRRQVPL